MGIITLELDILQWVSNMKKIYFLILIITAMLCGCGNDPYDNTTNKSELITEVYPESICEQIQYQSGVGGLHINDLRKIVDIECLRKTETGSYVILKLDNQKFAYIRIDENGMCGGLHQFQDFFYMRAELEEILKNVTSLREAQALLFNVVYGSTSGPIIAVYPVQEGYVVAVFSYDSLTNEDHALKTVEFYKDITDSPVWGDPNIFQILDIDRGDRGTVLLSPPEKTQ